MITWSELENNYIENLVSIYPKEEARSLFSLAIEHVANILPAQFAIMKKQLVPEGHIQQLNDILEELQSSRPIQHILKTAHFYGKLFEVNEHTLIPRSETEELVDLISRNHQNQQDLHIIDIGTGTACIAISLATTLSAPQTWAVDISGEALAIARRNAQRHQAAINFIQADILDWEFIFSTAIQFDIIVSNPPYITPREKEEMHQNVLNFEPHLALFVAEETPLLFYDHIAEFALVHLAPRGTLYFEINQYLGKETIDLLQKKGFKEINMYKDINGADRIISAKK